MPKRQAGDGELSVSLIVANDAGEPRELAAEPAPVPEPVPEPDLHLVLELHPADAAALLRAAPLTALREGRARTAPLEMVWHDTPDGALAQRGLALARCGRWWRLERLSPAPSEAHAGGGDWLPATPAPLLEETTEVPACVADAGALVPVAALRGQRRALRLDGASMVVIEGVLRGVTTELPVCRVTLAGPRARVARLAIELARLVRLSPPRAGLAIAARAVAAGVPAAARWLGPPLIPPGADVDRALTLFVAQSADAILHWAPLIGTAAGPQPLHQMRVAVRRLRAGLSVFAPAAGHAAFGDTAARLKDLAGRLGEARDWDVFLDGVGRQAAEQFPAERRLGAMLGAGRQRRDGLYDGLATWLAGPDYRCLAMSLALLPSLAPWRNGADDEKRATLAEPAELYGARRLERRRRHLAAAGKDIADLAPPMLHELRKQAKRTRYASEFFGPLFPPKRVKRYLKRLEAVQETLGALNDEAVTAGLLERLGKPGRGFAAGLVEGFAGAATGRRREHAAEVWRKCLEQPPFWN